MNRQILDTYKGLTNAADFWCANIVAAWQAEELDDDLDPHGATYGLTDFSTGFSSVPGEFGYIYVEAIREAEVPATSRQFEGHVLAHEIGHTRGLKHDNRTANIMHPASTGSIFTPEDINHLRKEPTQKKEPFEYITIAP